MIQFDLEISSIHLSQKLERLFKCYEYRKTCAENAAKCSLQHGGKGSV